MWNIILVVVAGVFLVLYLSGAAPGCAKRTSRARASERCSLPDVTAMRVALACLFVVSLMAGCATSRTRPPATAPPPDAAAEPQDHAS